MVKPVVLCCVVLWRLFNNIENIQKCRIISLNQHNFVLRKKDPFPPFWDDVYIYRAETKRSLKAGELLIIEPFSCIYLINVVTWKNRHSVSRAYIASALVACKHLWIQKHFPCYFFILFCCCTIKPQSMKFMPLPLAKIWLSYNVVIVFLNVRSL